MAVRRPIQMQVAGRTDVGLIREHNEDNLMVLDFERRRPEPLEGAARIDLGARGALLVVCDGMGGAAAGEVASQLAIETLSTIMLDRTAAGPPGDGVPPHVFLARGLRQASLEANRRILEAARSDDERAGMGTTMTSVCVTGGQLVMGQVGDSRAYVLRRGVLTQVTRDQSLLNELLESGQISEEQARLFEHSNVILQALGVQDEVEVQLSTVPLRRGDRVVVCTDGLTGVVSDEEIAAVLGGGDDMDQCCRVLVEMARTAGGPDNITVVAASFDGDALAEPAQADRVVYERWRLDEPEAPPPPRETQSPPPSPPEEPVQPPAQHPYHDPARTFFSLMLLLALTLGALVVASQLRRAPGVVRCQVLAPAGLAIRVDGREVGRWTRGEGTAIKLPPGRHRVGVRGRGAPGTDRTIEVTPAETCRVSFEDAH